MIPPAGALSESVARADRGAANFSFDSSNDSAKPGEGAPEPQELREPCALKFEEGALKLVLTKVPWCQSNDVSPAYVYGNAGDFFFSGAEASAQRATLRFSKRSRAKSKGRLDGDLVSGDWSGDRTLGSPRGTPGVKYTCDELLCLTTSDAPRHCSKTNTAPSIAPLSVFGQTVACLGALIL